MIVAQPTPLRKTTREVPGLRGSACWAAFGGHPKMVGGMRSGGRGVSSNTFTPLDDAAISH